MAKILVVDDRPANREYLITLLHHHGHSLLEASDGAEALALARAEHPELVIADIIMPTMDGYEFVKQLRVDPAIARTPVVFCTAHYLEREARSLAEKSGVHHILQKPIEAQQVLRIVAAALVPARLPAPKAPPEEFDREHLKLITDKLSREAEQLQLVNLRLAELIELGRQLNIERDPATLVQSYCRAAREIIGAGYTAVRILSNDGAPERFYTVGLEEDTSARIAGSFGSGGMHHEKNGELLAIRVGNPGGDPVKLGFSPQHPDIFSFLAAPIFTSGCVYGWLYLFNKLGESEFSEQEERLAVMLAAQLAVVYEKARLIEELARRASELEHEVAERKQVASALQQSERRLQAILDHSPALIFLKDPASRYLLVNRAFEQVTGRSNQEVVGRTDDDLFPDHIAAVRRVHEASILEARRPTELEEAMPHPDGVRTYLSVKFPLFDGAEKPYAVGAICTDITHRKKAEQAIRLAEETRLQLASIVESCADAIIGKRLDGTITSWNEGATRIFGYSAEEMIGANISKLSTDGLGESGSGILASVQRGERFEHEAVRRRKDGKEIAISLTISPIWDADGAIVGASQIARDITERRLIQQRLIRSQRLESLSALAGGIAHDFNNLFMSIVANASLILDEAPPESNLVRPAENVLGAVEQASHLTRQMLAYSGRGRYAIESLSLVRQIQDAVSLLQTTIPRRVQLELILASGLPTIVADANQIEQLVVNLVMNAVEAIEGAGRVAISAFLRDVAGGERLPNLAGADLAPGAYAALEVLDTGAGMDEATQAKIFDPFFSTKFTGRGLGLAAVLGIVRAHRAGISVSSQPGKGTVFQVFFPVEVKSALVSDRT